MAERPHCVNREGRDAQITANLAGEKLIDRRTLVWLCDAVAQTVLLPFGSVVDFELSPGLRSLPFALLENHLGGVLGAVERACRDSRDQPLDNMVQAVVGAFIDAKLNRADVSLALYKVASELESRAVIARLGNSARNEMITMLKTLPCS